MGFTSCLLKDRAWDWWEEVNRVVGTDRVIVMAWDDFVQRFQREFAPAIEVQQTEREFQDLRLTTETMADITAKFRERTLLIP